LEFVRGEAASYSAAIRPAAATSRAPRNPGFSWDRKYELAVTIELRLIEVTGIHRPYVHVDRERSQLRAHDRPLVRKYKYLNELRAWSREESMRPSAKIRIS